MSFSSLTRLVFHGCLVLLLCLCAIRANAADWPPAEGKKPRVIIDTDAANEIDDQYALALALGRPDRLQIEGIVAAHFGAKGGSKGIDKSHAEILRVLEKAGMAGKFPVLRGIDPLTEAPPTSNGLEFIIEKARSASPQQPLWLILLGPVTDAVAVLQKAPDVADRMIVFWHSRSAWPKECKNFNAKNDPRASQQIFALPARLVLFDTGTHLRMDMDETKRRLAPRGSLGAYLYDIRERDPEWRKPGKGVFDLGDIAAFVDPSTVTFEKTPKPRVTEQLLYDFSQPGPEIIRIKDVNRDASFALLEDALTRIPARGK